MYISVCLLRSLSSGQKSFMCLSVCCCMFLSIIESVLFAWGFMLVVYQPLRTFFLRKGFKSDLAASSIHGIVQPAALELVAVTAFVAVAPAAQHLQRSESQSSSSVHSVTPSTTATFWVHSFRFFVPWRLARVSMPVIESVLIWLEMYQRKGHCNCQWFGTSWCSLEPLPQIGRW